MKGRIPTLWLLAMTLVTIVLALTFVANGWAPGPKTYKVQHVGQ